MYSEIEVFLFIFKIMSVMLSEILSYTVIRTVQNKYFHDNKRTRSDIISYFLIK